MQNSGIDDLSTLTARICEKADLNIWTLQQRGAYKKIPYSINGKLNFKSRKVVRKCLSFMPKVKILEIKCI